MCSNKMNRWTIRVRVAHKKPIRTFSNGEGRLFSCDLIDETGEIRATGFGNDCDRFEPILIIGNVISFFFQLFLLDDISSLDLLYHSSTNQICQ